MTDIQLVFSSKAYKNLEDFVYSNSLGPAILIGSAQNDRVECLGVSICQSTELDAITNTFEEVTQIIPAGLNIIGATAGKQLPEDELLSICKHLINKSEEMSQFLVDTALDDRIVLGIPSDDSGLQFVIYSGTEQAILSNLTVNVTTGKLSDTMTIQVESYIPLTFSSDSKHIISEALQEAIELVQKEVQSECSSFMVVGSSTLLHEVTLSNDKQQTCERLLELNEPTEGGNSTKNKKQRKNHVQVELMLKLTGPEAETRVSSCLPVIYYHRKSFVNIIVPLQINSLAVVPVSTPLIKIPSLLRESVSRQLDAMFTCLSKYSKDGDFCVPEPFHFNPEDLEHPVTLVYPQHLKTAELLSVRTHFHKLLGLPMDRPQTRRANCVKFGDLRDPAGYLYNTHIGLQPSGVSGGEVSLVKGTYTYHHYMQDGIDDNGWGCAYRSLQTVVSSFRHQGYTQHPVPSHREIQQTLVDIGDKPHSFVGTKKWIGAMEVSFCLESMLGVTCRILNVNSGGELAYHGQDLVNHFKTQGTPIMIGGGVLAHTILGVHYNQQTGDIKFLILDPHYTGAEELSTIQNKGWCGWKAMKFWDKSAFYNLCMPQRPREI